MPGSKDTPVAASPHPSVALPVLAVVIVLAAACGGGDAGPTTFDLARQRPALSLLGAQANDKVRALAAGDVNGDGQQDIIVGAFNADGPDGTREDTGQAYVIPIGPRLQ